MSKLEQITYTANNLNQYTAVGAVSLYYDNNGNLTDDGTYDYQYDIFNRLTLAEYNSVCIGQYYYDHGGRRIAKDAGGTVTKYAYDGAQVIAEYDGTDTLLRKFIYGPGIDEPICMIDAAGAGETRYYYHYDGLGSIIALSNISGTVVEKYAYDAFGTTTVIQDGGTQNPYRFTGRRWDDEIDLYYYRARMYSPTLGRFLQTDPIGYDDGMNMYTYCGNNPTDFIDPLGLCKDDDLNKLFSKRQALLDYIASAERAVIQNIETLNVLHGEKDFWRDYYKYVLYINTGASIISATTTAYGLVSGVRTVQSSTVNLGIQGYAKNIIQESMGLRQILHESEFFVLTGFQASAISIK